MEVLVVRSSCSLPLKQFSRALYCYSGVHYFKMEDTVKKRGKMLMKIIQNKDKRKHWDMQVKPTGSPDQSIYDKVHRPHKRASVLNALFMRNITDVMSTGDVCPDVMGFGVEITGVRVTSDYQIVNVFWQIPDVEETCNSSVENILAKAAPDVRTELIRRNVLGKVPRIYFIRDPTNKRLAEFQRCLDSSGVSEIKVHPTFPADYLMKNMFKFPQPQDENVVKSNVEVEKLKEKVASSVCYVRPPDMKYDVMGLDHEKILSKVLTAKRNSKQTPHIYSLPVDPATEDSDESKNKNLVYSIPATPLVDDENERKKQLKQFYVHRRTQHAKINKISAHEKTAAISCDTAFINDSDNAVTDEIFEEDYLEEESGDTDNDR